LKNKQPLPGSSERRCRNSTTENQNGKTERTEKGIDAGVANGEKEIENIDCKGRRSSARYIP
jgi:hypothetical protein